MCTAATYKTKDFYFGRTLDYEFSYGDQIVITPRKKKGNAVITAKVGSKEYRCKIKVVLPKKPAVDNNKTPETTTPSR